MEDVAGGTGLRLLFAAMTAALAAAGWALTRPAGALARRAVALAPFLLVGLLGWTHRPYLVAYGCLAAVLLACDRWIDPRWLLVVGWVWLNSHGSWPLGLAAATALWFGARLDGDDASGERRALGWLATGLMVGLASPYGIRLLTFPAVALERRDIFSEITEWKPPTFSEPDQIVFLVGLAVAIGALRIAPSWRLAVPLAAFTVAALLSARNVHVASIVFVPVTARALAAPSRPTPRLLERAAVPLAIAVGAVAVGVATQKPAFDLGIYPVEGTLWLEERELSPDVVRVVAPDFVGNWFEFRYGTDAQVFIDDRFEVVPRRVVEDYLGLLSGAENWREILDRYEPAAVVWRRDRPLATLLEQSDCWSVAHRDDDFVVAIPAPTCS